MLNNEDLKKLDFGQLYSGGVNLGFLGKSSSQDLNNNLIVDENNIVTFPFSKFNFKDGDKILFGNNEYILQKNVSGKYWYAKLKDEDLAIAQGFYDPKSKEQLGTKSVVEYIDRHRFEIIIVSDKRITKLEDIAAIAGVDVGKLKDAFIDFPASLKLDGNNGDVCGKFLYVLHNVPGSVVRLMPLAEIVSDYITNPTASGYPNPTGSTYPNPSEDYEKADKTNKITFADDVAKRSSKKLQFDIIKWKNDYSKLDKGSVIIDLLDTSTNYIDNYSYPAWDTFNGAKEQREVPGHGSAIAQLIWTNISPSLKINFERVCDRNICDAKSLITAVCSVQQAAQRDKGNGIYHIINLSLGNNVAAGTQLLTYALMDASKMGVATVLSNGNTESCKYTPANQVCLQYPGDSLTNTAIASQWPNVYIVGSSFNDQEAHFNRNYDKRLGNNITRNPDVYVPGVLFQEQDTKYKNSDLMMRSGTSFATGLMSGYLALWKQCPNNISKDWPMSNGGLYGYNSTPILNLEVMFKNCS
ncbi:hypothetical protein E7T09_14995 [Deinococcus sp. KSM4-11]|uniref:S8/S53 family peptidase n=1 Tax=Deinococcus sp. KSM4-11 TaxID=2568654 RepID=UPI0010A3B3E2|nr:S8/S53 family peptidase [Deinococcus sp. KSM4-11]THF85823.1 hypothetical protein E7T09_14995 [Deinococcus sp. KSM4-11]